MVFHRITPFGNTAHVSCHVFLRALLPTKKMSRYLLISLFVYFTGVFSAFAVCTTAFNNNESVSMLTGQTKNLQFWTADPSCLAYVYRNQTFTIAYSSISVSRVSDGSVIKTISIADPAVSANVLSSELFNNLAGEYSLTYNVKQKEVERSDCGTSCIHYTDFRSTKNIKLYPDTTPVFRLVNKPFSVKYGESINIELHATDAGGKLRDSPTLYVGDSNALWTNELISCSINTSFEKKCIYRLRPGTFAFNIKTHSISAAIRDRFNKKVDDLSSIDVYEDNIAPSFGVDGSEFNVSTDTTLIPIEIVDYIPIMVGDITTFIPVKSQGVTDTELDRLYVAPGAAIALSATASDANIAAMNQLKEVRWCYNSRNDTSSCSLIQQPCTAKGADGRISCNKSHQFTITGDYWLWAEAIDNGGLKTTSSLTQITVVGEPSVSFTASSDFRLGAMVNLSAVASGVGTLQLQLCRGGSVGDVCNTPVSHCRANSCNATFYLDPAVYAVGNQAFYAVVTDGYGRKHHAGETKNILGSYTVSSPSISGVHYPGETVSISGAYQQISSGTVSRVELLNNYNVVGSITNPQSNFNIGFTLNSSYDISRYNLRFRLVDSAGIVITSDNTVFDVETKAPSGIPKVSAGTATSVTGKINLSLTAVANNTGYHWYELAGSCPSTSTPITPFVSTLAPSTIRQKNYQNNGQYCYCAAAFNPKGTGTMGIGASCALVTVAIPDSVPGLTRFTPTLALTQTQPYLLSWINDNLGARTFKLERQVGQGGTNWSLLASGLTTKSWTVSQLSPGDVSYRISACNNDNVCEAGQIIVVNHQVPYLHQARFVPVAGQAGEILFDGLGLGGIAEAKVQLRNTAEVITLAVTIVSATQSKLVLERQNILHNKVLQGLNSGGLRLFVSNALGSSSIEFDMADSTSRVDIDLIKASPTVSDSGIVYVGSGAKLHALDQAGRNLPNWPFTLSSAPAAEFSAAPSLDKDANGHDLIYVGATDRNVYKLDQQKNLLWRTGLRSAVYGKALLLSQPDAYHNNEMRKLLFVGTSGDGSGQNGIYALDPQSGQQRYMYPLLAGVKQTPAAFDNGQLHVTTEDDQLHIIDRSQLSPFALRWQDIDSSLIKTRLENLPYWEIPEDANIPLNSLIGLFYGLLERSPTKEELTFFAYAHWSGMSSYEITAAFLGSDKGLQRLPIAKSNTEFVDLLFTFLFPSEPNKVSAAGLTRAQWVALLDDNHSRSEVAWRLIQSDEYYSYSGNVTELVRKVFFEHCNCNEVQDSDNDGTTDVLELELGYNPLDPFDLALARPQVSASEPVLGDFSLSWQSVVSPDAKRAVFYMIDESVNQQPSNLIVAEHSGNDYGLVKASGNYSYRVKACIHTQICSQWSDTAAVEVGDSMAEARAQPEAAPTEVADYSPPSSDLIADSARLGFTAGQFRVNESGAATYTLPFFLPQGIAGVAPELGVGYNSQGRAGSIGLGWDLQGGSAISRCGSTVLIDGFNASVQLNAEDNFCLDGQRLLLKSGTKGLAGSIYTTETDAQLQITYNADDSFSIEGKDRSLKVFGGSAESRLILDAQGNAVTMSWFISKVQDNLRQTVNEIVYSYANGLGSHEKRLDSISYSGNRVAFEYDYDGSIKGSGYLLGNRFAQRAYLKGVSIYNQQNSLLRSYHFVATDNELGQRQITAIKECTGDICKRGLSFSYRDVFTQNSADISFVSGVMTPAGEYLRHALMVDTNNDGKNEIVTLTQVSATQTKLCVGDTSDSQAHCQSFTVWDDLQEKAQVVPTDPDGDGLFNLLVNTDNNQDNGGWIQFNILAGGGLSAMQSVPLAGDTSLGTNIKAMDINGDGFNDLIETVQRSGATDSEVFARIWDRVSQQYLAPVKVKLNYNRAFSPQISSGWQSADFDQDGVADLMLWGKYEMTCNPEDDASCKLVQGKNLYLFKTDPKVRSSTDPNCEQRSGGARCTSAYYSAIPYASIELEGKHAQPIDINGDGLTDIVVYNTGKNRWQYHLNTGDGFLVGADFSGAGQLSSAVAPMVTDVDADGRLELVFHHINDSKWYRYEWTHAEVDNGSGMITGGFIKVLPELSAWSFSPPPEFGVGANRIEYGQFADADSDGLLDFVYKEGRKNAAAGSLKLYHAGSRVAHPGLLSSVTTGSGVETHIEYGSMADPFLYTVGKTVPAALVGDGARVFNMAGTGTLVKAVTTDAPVGSGTEEVKVEYLYKGARVQFGRGPLGFESISTLLYKDGVSFNTTTEYSQEFPLLGMPLKTTKTAAGTLISVAENRNAVTTVALGDGYQYYQVYQNESRDCQANVDSINGGAVSVQSFNCQQLITAQDEFANVTETHTGQYDESDAVAFVAMTDNFNTSLKTGALKSVATVNDYGSSDFSLRYGRLVGATATHSRGTESITRSSSFDYYDNGMLKQEVIEPEGDCNTKLVTEYEYDALGNLTRKQVHNDTSCTPALSREAVSVFDAEGRYVTQSVENGVLVSKVLTRNALGQPTQVENADGVQARMRFDVFGAEVYRYGASGAQTQNLVKACDSGDNPCYAMAEVTENGIAVKKQYLDTAGRVFKESSLDVLGNWHSREQGYDKYGRVSAVIEPGLEAVTSTYDAFDRVIETNDPNTGTIASQSFSGRQQLNTLSGDIPDGEQTKTTVYNALGEQYQVSDSLGNILTYSYEVQGNLDTVHSSVDNKILSDIAYDKLGRKKTMVDENRGRWRYEYDALGQLTKQTDARGVITEVFYDNLGRKKHQKITGTAEVLSEEMFWVYGSGDNRHRLQYEHSGSWRRDYYYDHLGRAVASLTNLDGTSNCVAKVVFKGVGNDLRILDEALADPIASRCVIQQSFFDEYGRVFQQFDDYRRRNDSAGTFIDARGIRHHYANNQLLKQQEAREGTAGRIYNELVTIDGDGLLTEYRKGNQLMTLSYDAAKRLAGISSGNHIQADIYSYDGLNNLSRRQLTGREAEAFGYDELNRVIQVDGVTRFGYDANGNLREKEGWTLEYADGAADPLHAVTKRSKAGMASETYGYDANGNQIWGKKNGSAWRTFEYSGRNKATRIEVDGKETRFSYDANNNRFKRVDSEGTIFYVGNLELTIKGANASGAQQSYIKRYLGDAMQTYYADGNSLLRWLYKDHLGSIVAITNDSGKLVKRFRYDVFGLQTEIPPTAAEFASHYEQTALSSLLLAEVSPSTRGYTGHEPVDVDADKRIIHMNGRMYDASLGRMLQADPMVQSPDNLQNYNSYSYVLNNPLNATDPSGYFFKKLGEFIKKYWKPIVAIIVTVVSYGYLSKPAAAWATASGYSATTGAVVAGAGAGAIGGGVGGALQTGTFTGALRGAFTGAIAGAAGGYANFGAVGGIGDAAMRVGVSALGGCAAGKVSGGSCSQGAKLAALAQALKMGMDNFSGDNSSYKTSEGEAVIKPGGALKAKMLAEGKNVDWINKDVTNTGMGVTIDDPKLEFLVGKSVSEAKSILASMGRSDALTNATSAIGEAGGSMRWLSENVGGVRSASVMHDGLVGSIERALGMENTWYGTAFTVGSIPPAFIAQYAALGVGNDYYYAKNLKRNY